MEQTYQHLLTLAFKHNYFKGGEFKSLQVSLDNEAVSLIKNLGLVLKSFSGGVHILAAEPELLNNPTLALPIRLHFACNDPYYINYSEAGDNWTTDSILYFNNLDPIPNSGCTGIQLHSDEYVSQNDVMPLSFGQVIIPDFDPDNECFFEDVLGNDISKKITQSPDKADRFLISNLPQGIIKIFSFDIEKESQVYYYPNSVWKKPLGIVELYAPQLYDQFVKNGKQVYTVHFNTRKTIWKYFLISPTFQKFGELNIIDRDNNQVFKPAQKIMLQGSEALVFESKNKMALVEYSDNFFQLVDQFDPALGSGNVIIKNLPTASPEQLFYDDDKKTMYSHIYL